MAEIRRLVNLPGYDDTSRDVYETTESTDGDSSIPTPTPASPRSPSETSNTSDDEDGDGNDDTGYGVSRRRLHPARARTRFGAVQTGGNVDLSDRVDGRRRGYRVRRVQEQEEEGLEARIARLRREVEECKAEAEKELDFGGREESAVGDLEGLGTVLAGIGGEGRRRQGGNGQLSGRVKDVQTTGSQPDGGGEVVDERLIGRVADFDSRLAALEKALGISSLDGASIEALTTPVLPSLTLLDQQMAALTAASSLAHLEAASAKIQKLRGEAEQLAQFQSRPATTSNAEDEDDATPVSLSHEDMLKLQNLYQILPTLQSLSPTVPALLARLRSLATLHSSAATAASVLDEIEKRQREMDAELKAWREGLEKVEAAVAQAGETNGRNGKVVKQWVDDLETRMKAL